MSHKLSHTINTDYSITRDKYSEVFDADGNSMGLSSPNTVTISPQYKDEDGNWQDTDISSEEQITQDLAGFVWTASAKQEYRDSKS